MAYDPNAYQSNLQKYLEQMRASGAYGDGGGGGGGGGGGAGGIAAAIASLGLQLGVKYAVKNYGVPAVKDFLARQGIGPDKWIQLSQSEIPGAISEGSAALNSGTALLESSPYLAGNYPAFSLGAGAASAAPVAAETGQVAGTYLSGAPAFSLGAEGSGIYASQAAGAGAAEAGTTAGTTTTAAGAGGGTTGAAAAAPWVAAAIAAYMTYRNRSKMSKEYGTGLTDDEIQKTAPLGDVVFNKLGPLSKVMQARWKYGDLAPLRFIEEGLWGAGKNEAQLWRDRIRNKWQDNKLLDDKYNITLTNGDKFDLGRDGSNFKLQNEGGGERSYWDPDMATTKYNPFEAQALIQPLAAISSAGAPNKLAMLGHLINAAGSNAKSDTDIYNNARAFAQKMGLTKDNYGATIDELAKDQEWAPELTNQYKGKLSWLTAEDSNRALGDFLASIKTNQQQGLYEKLKAQYNGGKGVNAFS